MAKNRKQLIHLHTSEVKAPSQGVLNLGEIAVQHNDTEAALYIEKNNGTIAKFIDATAVEAKVELEKTRAEGAEGTLNGKIETLTSAVTDNEKVVATALNQIVKSVGLDENGNSPLPQNISLTDAIKDVTNKVSTLEGSNHTHANKDVLDGITTEKVNAWDAAKANAISSAKTYADSLNTAMDSRVDALETSSHSHDNKTVLDGITTQKVTAWDAAEANAKSYADGLAVNYDASGAAAQALVDAKAYTNSKVDGKFDDKGAAAKALTDAKSYADGLNTAMAGRVKGVESTISTLVGEDTGKSVRSVSAEEVAKIVNSADTRYDTLKEIADWIISDTTGSAQMANDISALKAVSADTRLVKLESKSHSHTNKSLLDTYTQTETDLADAVAKKHKHTNKTVLDGITTQKVTAWDAAEANAKADAAEKYQVKGNYETAGAAAEAFASAKTYTDGLAVNYDAAGSAAAAFASAKTYTDGLDAAMDSRVDVLEASSHSHDNKTVLDGITDVKVAAWDAAEANAKKYVDGKVNGKFDDKGAAAQALKDAKVYADSKVDGKFDDKGAAAQALVDAKSYADGLNTAMDGRVDVLEASSHTHGNKNVLDGITAEKVNAWDAAKANAISSAKTYADSLNTAMDSRVGILETSSHTHGNKTVLDGITDVKVAAWDAAEANAISSAITYTNTVLETIRIDCGTY